MDLELFSRIVPPDFSDCIIAFASLDNDFVCAVTSANEVVAIVTVEFLCPSMIICSGQVVVSCASPEECVLAVRFVEESIIAFTSVDPSAVTTARTVVRKD